MDKIQKANIRKLTAVISALVFASNLLKPNQLFAGDVNRTEPPSFPTCESKIFSSNGDHDHTVNGNFYVIGVGWRFGTDDVYTLSNGNYLQCYCPNDRSTGIQSDWWNADNADLSDEDISFYKSHGWFEEQGKDRNLPDNTFLVKNRDFSCAQPTPMVTPTATLTPTPQPTVTPTPGPEGPQSRCFDLEANPSEGTSPLTVRFTAHADDPVTQGKIKDYKFDFGDASGGQPQVWSQTDRVAYHKYELSGEYTAKVDIQDNAGNWRGSDDCRVKIKVNQIPPVLGASTPSKLPTTGLPVALALLAPSLTVVGVYLYRLYTLV